MAIDLSIYPVARLAGSAQPGLYSLYVSEPGSQATRSRKIDRLILYLVMIGDPILRPLQQDQILEHIAGVYYKTPGSATAAMRHITDELNGILLEINLRFAPKGQQAIAWLTAAIIRREQVYLTQSGPMNAFWIKDREVQHLCDYSMIGRGLGQGRSTPISYFQVDIQPNDSLLLAAQPSPSWNTETLASKFSRNPDRFRQQLFDDLDADINAVLIQAARGKGTISLVPAQDLPIPAKVDEKKESADLGGRIPIPLPPSAPVIAGVPAGREDGQDLREETSADVWEYSEPAKKVDAERIEAQPDSTTGAVLSVGGEVDTPPASTRERKRLRLPTLKGMLAAVSAPLTSVLRWTGSGASALFQRAIPGADSFNIPGSTMAFIAIAIPIFIVALASAAYFQLGRAAQFESLYAQAGEIIERVNDQDDLLAQKPDWEQLLALLNQIETIDRTAETQSLRARAIEALDQMDLVKRVDFQPAIVSGLPENVSITRIAAIDNDLYMLDGERGDVIRAQLTSKGYQVDPSFQCSMEITGDTPKAAIIDIERWPNGLEPNVDLIAVDSLGRVLFCDPERNPELRILAAPSGSAFEQVTAMTIALGDVYVLDPMRNGVWIYWKGDLEREPELFFDVEIPMLGDVVDFTVSQDELYLLHESAAITLCVFNALGVAPTRCSELEYKDYRPGNENAPMAPDHPFNQILLNPPPDPSLFFLEPESKAIYHFSLRSLAYQRQYKSQQPLADGNATAFAVDPVKRNFFLAAGSKVYYGFIP